MGQRLFIVSNRLPISIENKDGQYSSRQSSGGLVSAINAYLKGMGKGIFAEKVWAGVPDCSKRAWQSINGNFGESEYSYLPVFMDWKKYELYYNGFSNSLLWPLFHYFPSFADYNSSYFDAYIKANEEFAELLSQHLCDNDVVWIHDYHLLPLAGMLRNKFPNITIGFFLHIPFPSYELFRVMPKPWQEAILKGMLGADLIGFHTTDYSTHFLSCLERVLKLEHDGQYISWGDRKIKADVFPISIDFDLFHDAYHDAEVTKIRGEYLNLKGDRKLLFSVDRLDYTKGISNRLKGYEQFFVENPDYIGKVIFALVIVPSRDSITKYAERKKMIDEYISHLNSKIGNIGWQPVIYQYNHLSFNELVALYTACDVALITPLRDGMNLVSKEFIASRKDKRGVLVLSEMAGAAKEFGEALLINPNDTKEIASMIKCGLEMPEEEQSSKMAIMQQRIRRYDINAWATDFFSQLRHVKELQHALEAKFLSPTSRLDLADKYALSIKRLILLDYDGTLVPFAKTPSMAAPNNDILDVLKKLSSDALNDVYIISGRDSHTLENWLGHLPIGLIAEHGAKTRHKDGAWETAAVASPKGWKGGISTLMEIYEAKCPNSFIEHKEYSLAWHYRNADPRQGAICAKELREELVASLHQSPLDVLNGNKVVEVRAKEINKGAAVGNVLQKANYDFILSIGDDETDEDMFGKLSAIPQAFTIKVGKAASLAKYNLHAVSMVETLLRALSLSGQESFAN